MSPEKLNRRLAAILSADVKGYSRLMGEDEEWTLRTLNSYKGLIGNLVREHRGRVVASPGDNVLAEFASVVDAVECGVDIQKELQAKNALLPETRKMDFRIGINLGDVIEEGDSIYGDGVNIAARLECLRRRRRDLHLRDRLSADREQVAAALRVPGGKRGQEHCEAGEGLPGADRAKGAASQLIKEKKPGRPGYREPFWPEWPWS